MKKNFNSYFLEYLNLNNNSQYSNKYITFHLTKKLEKIKNLYILDDKLINMIKKQNLKESNNKLLIADVYELIPFWKNIFIWL